MAVSDFDRNVFRRIGEVESEPRPTPASFDEALSILDRLLERDRAMYPSRTCLPDEDEFRAHEVLYARARTRGLCGD